MAITKQGAVAWAWLALVAGLLAAPWINPFTPVPSPTVGPLLFTWACTALVLLVLAVRGGAQRQDELVRALALAWGVAAAVNAAIGIVQYVGWSRQFGVWVDHIGPGMAFGNLRQHNQFATLMSIGTAATLWWAGRGAAGKLALPLVVVVLLAIGNATSISRTGFLQLVLLLLLTLWWWRTGAASRRESWVVLAGLSAYAIANVVLPWLLGGDVGSGAGIARLLEGDSGCDNRKLLWSNVLHLIALKPWLGWGWGELDYAHFITLYDQPRFCNILDNAHNLPLHLAVELGVPVALLACGIGLWLVWCGRPWAERDPARRLAWSVLAVIGLHSLLEYPLWYGPFQVAALACVGLLAWPVLGASLSVRRRRTDAVLAAVLILSLSGYAARDYRIARQIYLPPPLRAAAYRDDTLRRSQGSWIYADYFRFAVLNLMQLTPENAIWARTLALSLLHFSPEARVVRVLLDADRLLGKDEEMAFYEARYRAAFPEDYARWKAGPAPKASAPGDASSAAQQAHAPAPTASGARAW